MCDGSANHNRDFRLPRVRSINASGHKFGLVPLAVGWIVWRDVSYVPEDLVFESSYLRGTHKAFTLSFSRSGYPIVFQYHNFLHLGMEGYRDRVRTSLTMARRLSNWLEATGYFHCLSDIHRCYAHLKTDCDVCEWRTGREVHPGLPMVVFSFSETTRREHPSLSLAALSNAMLDSRFSIPSEFSVDSKANPNLMLDLDYVLPMRSTNSKRLDVMRIVIRTEFDDDLLQRVLTAIVDHIERLIEENTAIPDDGHDQLYPKMSKNILD